MRELLGRGRSKKGIFEGDLVEGELEIGQIVSLINDLPSAAEVVKNIIDEYNIRLENFIAEKPMLIWIRIGWWFSLNTPIFQPTPETMKSHFDSF